MAQLTSRAAVVVFEYIRLERRVDAAFESIRMYEKRFPNTLHASKSGTRRRLEFLAAPSVAQSIGPDSQVDATPNHTIASSISNRLNDPSGRRLPPRQTHLAERTAIARALETTIIWSSNEKPATKLSLAQKQCIS